MGGPQKEDLQGCRVPFLAITSISVFTGGTLMRFFIRNSGENSGIATETLKLVALIMLQGLVAGVCTGADVIECYWDWL